MGSTGRNSTEILESIVAPSGPFVHRLGRLRRLHRVGSGFALRVGSSVIAPLASSSFRAAIRPRQGCVPAPHPERCAADHPCQRERYGELSDERRPRVSFVHVRLSSRWMVWVWAEAEAPPPRSERRFDGPLVVAEVHETELRNERHREYQ